MRIKVSTSKPKLEIRELESELESEPTIYVYLQEIGSTSAVLHAVSPKGKDVTLGELDIYHPLIKSKRKLVLRRGDRVIQLLDVHADGEFGTWLQKRDVDPESCEYLLNAKED